MVGLSEYNDLYPTRLPVWWARHGDVSPHPDTTGISGRKVTIRILKQTSGGRGLRKLLQGLEELAFKLTRGPRVLRRPLDEMNSLLWELCDGSRMFSEICELMDQTFHESIAPVEERTMAALVQFESLGFLTLLDSPLDDRWLTGPGVCPAGQMLPEVEQDLRLDAEPLPGEQSG